MKRILLVEDEQALARHLTRLLQAEGFTVVHAATQRAAAAVWRRPPWTWPWWISPCPMETALPSAPQSSRPAIPVLFLTASADEDSVVTGCAWGAMTISPSPSAHGSSWRGSPPPAEIRPRPLGLFPPWPDGGHRQPHGAKAGAGGVSLPSGVPPAADLHQ